jgi:hypothetical protein
VRLELASADRRHAGDYIPLTPDRANDARAEAASSATFSALVFVLVLRKPATEIGFASLFIRECSLELSSSELMDWPWLFASSHDTFPSMEGYCQG